MSEVSEFIQESFNNWLPKEAKSERANTDVVVWQQWKDNPNKINMKLMLKQLKPVITAETNRWIQSGVNPVSLSIDAHNLAMEAIASYNPNKSQLNTHVTNHLKKLSRIVIEQQNSVRMPEEQIYQHRKDLKNNAEAEFEMGDDITAGVPIGKFKPIIEHYYSKASEAGATPVQHELSYEPIAIKMFYNDLSDKHKKIFDYLYKDTSGKKPKGKELAKVLGISPAMVSKHKKVIERNLNSYINSLQTFNQNISTQ